MPRAPKSKALPPLYLVRAGERCPRCRQATNVHALVASGLYDAREESKLPVPLLLEYLQGLPEPFLAMLSERCPGWRYDREDPSWRHAMNPGATYLMNHCMHCDAPLPDYYLHGEPGSAFVPTCDAECEGIGLYLLPEEDVSLDCGFSSGGLTDWLDYGRAKPWEALPLLSPA
jgi:hypothetical protein